MYFVIFRKDGDRIGEIVRYGHASAEDVALQLMDHEDDLDLLPVFASDIETEYVDDYSVKTRPSMGVNLDKSEIASDNTDTANLSGVPSGAVININGTEYAADGEIVSLTSDRPAVYNISVRLWPYLDATFAVEAI